MYIGRGGTRRLTAAEIAENELRHNDKDASTAQRAAMAAKFATGTSEIPIIDLTTPSTSPQQHRDPVVMSFSNSGALVQSSIVSPLRSTNVKVPMSARLVRRGRIRILLYLKHVVQRRAWQRRIACQKSLNESRYSSPCLQSPETSSSRTEMHVSKFSIHQGSLIRPRKRRKC